MMSEFKHWWGMAGIVLMISSIFSLIQRSFDVPLALKFAEIVGYYREALHPLYRVLHAPIRWLGEFFAFSIPDWLQDAHTLSFVCAALFVRAQNTLIVNGERRYPTLLIRLYIVFFCGYSLIGLLMLPFVLFATLTFPLYAFNHARWYGRKNLLQNMYAGSGETGVFIGLAIYSWIAMAAVGGLLLMNTLINQSR